MRGKTVLTLLRSTLPIALFVLGCFPSRGLYFLLHPATSGGRYFAHQPVIKTPANQTPQMRAAKVPLPSRLSRVPRSLKQSPNVAAPGHDCAFLFTPDWQVLGLAPVLTDVVLLQPFPSSPPPSRAPPASV